MKRQQHLLLLLVFIFLTICATLLVKDFDAIVARGTKIDSIGHMLGFFLLTWLLNGICRIPLLNISITLIPYAALTEIAQWYLGFRNAEVSDFIADVVGLSAYVILKWLKVMYFQKAR